MGLEIERVTVRYGALTAVDDVSVTADEGEVLVVLGPSGCGKSTLLRAIAGLEPLTSGRIRIAGRDQTGVPPERRDVGVAFQDGALFPHRSVADNIAFGPRMRGWDRLSRQRRVDEVLELVDLAGHADRRVTELSGGEAQRVALARAIAARPRLLLLDEPLGALDRSLRDRLVAELPKVFADSHATVVHVTHDQDEALTLADRVAVMRAGRLRQVGTPDQLWREPADADVARFLGLDMLVPGTRTPGGVRTSLGAWTLPPEALTRFGVGEPVTVLLLPDALSLGHPLDGATPDVGARIEGRHPVDGIVTRRRFAGDHLVVEIESIGGVPLHLSLRGHSPEPGTPVTVLVDAQAVRLLPPEV